MTRRIVDRDNLCFDCANCYTDKCVKIAHSEKIEGLISHNGPLGDIIDYCPNFQKDEVYIGICQIADLLGLAPYDCRDQDMLKEELNKRGYNFYVIDDDYRHNKTCIARKRR